MSNMNKYNLYEGDENLTAAEYAAKGITSVKGLGGVDIPINQNGFLLDPAGKLPNGVLDTLKQAWSDSNGDTSKFFSQTVDINGHSGTVEQLLKNCPSQQSYGIAKALDLPKGTAMPCQPFADKGYTAIKYGEGIKNTPAAGAPSAGDAGAGAGVAGAGAGDAGAGAGDGGVGASDAGAGAGSGVSGLEFFTDPNTLIAVGVVTGVAALIAGIYALSKTIKARFRKTAKILYKLQKDFGGSPNGLDMDNAFKGVGSRITDVIVKMFGFGKKGKGALGIVPFVQGYRDEIAADYKTARDAYDNIVLAGKKVDASVGPNTETHESAGVIYTSFYEALKGETLNESENPEAVNESIILPALALAVTAGKIAYTNGCFNFLRKKKDGSEEKVNVQVTQQSTREICWGIMNSFFSKYFNNEGVSKKLGFNVDSLGDLNSSNVDKFAKLVEAMKQEQKDNKQVSKMFNRVKTRYDKMVKSYLSIARNLVENFVKHSRKLKTKDGKEMSEKDDNLLFSAKTKLEAELDRQQDIYENNFYRVVNAIVSSKEYIEYIDFIIQHVIPVFKSGLASDADYVLDVQPKVGELYLVRQTTEDKIRTDNNDNVYVASAGNIAIVEIIGVDNDNVKFKRHCRVMKDYEFNITDKGSVDLSGLKKDECDFNAYKKDVRNDSGENNSNITDVEIPLKKWKALDPRVITNCNFITANTRPDIDTNNIIFGMQRSNNAGEEEMLFVIPEETHVNDSEKTPSYDSSTSFTPDTKINEDDAAAPDSKEAVEEAKKKNVKSVVYVKKDASGKETAIPIQVTGEFTVQDFMNFANQPGNGNDKMGFNAIDDLTVVKQKLNDGDTKNAINKSSVEKAEKKEEIPSIINRVSTVFQDMNNNIRKYVTALSKEIGSLQFNDADFNKTNVARNRYENGTIEVNVENKPSRKVIGISTGLKNSADKEIWIGIEIYNNGQSVQNQPQNNPSNPATNGQTPNNQPSTQIDKTKLTGIPGIFIQDSPNSYTTRAFGSISKTKVQIDNLFVNDNNTIKVNERGIWQALIGVIKEADNGKIIDEAVNTPEVSQTPVSNNDNVQYSTPNTVGEMANLNIIKVNRNIKSSINTNGLYILSETCWGVGTVMNPDDSLEKTFNKIFESYKTYSDIASYAKNHKNVSFVPFNESCEIKVQAPYYRYSMLTKGCPLYEHLSYFKFDTSEEKKVIEVYNLGTKSFIK